MQLNYRTANICKRVLPYTHFLLSTSINPEQMGFFVFPQQPVNQAQVTNHHSELSYPEYTNFISSDKMIWVMIEQKSPSFLLTTRCLWSRKATKGGWKGLFPQIMLEKWTGRKGETKEGGGETKYFGPLKKELFQCELLWIQICIFRHCHSILYSPPPFYLANVLKQMNKATPLINEHRNPCKQGKI